jgi:hypothetical protein
MILGIQQLTILEMQVGHIEVGNGWLVVCGEYLIGCGSFASLELDAR